MTSNKQRMLGILSENGLMGHYESLCDTDALRAAVESLWLDSETELNFLDGAEKLLTELANAELAPRQGTE